MLDEKYNNPSNCQYSCIGYQFFTKKKQLILYNALRWHYSTNLVACASIYYFN